VNGGGGEGRERGNLRGRRGEGRVGQPLLSDSTLGTRAKEGEDTSLGNTEVVLFERGWKKGEGVRY